MKLSRPQVSGCQLLLVALAMLMMRPAMSQNFDGCLTIVPPPWEAVTFDGDIQPIFDRSCVSCHQPGASDFAQHQLDLRPGFAYRNLVGKPSAQNPAWPLVVPFRPDDNPGSLLWWKVSCTPPPVGAPMPPAPSSLSAPERRALYIWVLRGAPPDRDGTGEVRAIEAGHSGTWFDPSTPGHGFSLEVVSYDKQPDRPSLLIAFWMTFDLYGTPRWLVGLGEFEKGATSVEMVIYDVRGGVFDAAQFRPTSEPIGAAELSFSSCREAWFRFDIQLDPDLSEPVLQRTIALRRLTPAPRCESAD